MSPTSQNHCRQRPCRSPHGAADALVVEHLHFAAKVAANFIVYARLFVNGEITHYLRDKGFLISVPGSWRELHARGQKLLRQGIAADHIPKQLGLTPERWAEITAACSVRVVAMARETQETDQTSCSSLI